MSCHLTPQSENNHCCLWRMDELNPLFNFFFGDMVTDWNSWLSNNILIDWLMHLYFIDFIMVLYPRLLFLHFVNLPIWTCLGDEFISLFCYSFDAFCHFKSWWFLLSSNLTDYFAVILIYFFLFCQSILKNAPQRPHIYHHGEVIN